VACLCSSNDEGSRLPSRGVVRVSKRAHTPSWVYRRRLTGRALEMPPAPLTHPPLRCFQALGEHASLPEYLRSAAPVRDLQLTRADVRALVLDVWAEKLAATHTAKLKMPQVSMAPYLGSQLLRRADNCPQPQEARPRSHARTTFQFNLTFRLLGSSVWSGGGVLNCT
jgi:hypothetical protein